MAPDLLAALEVKIMNPPEAFSFGRPQAGHRCSRKIPEVL
jgi:hypothetical protein